MFDSVLELVSQATSNSLFVFCCCNLIIVIILMGSKPSSSFEQGRESCVPVVANTSANGVQVKETNYCMRFSDENVKRVVCVEEELNVEGEQEPDDDEEEEESSSFADGDKEDDEFRRRIEEFIHKINSGWKAELLRTSCLV
ncbi:uncharacterized protein LOC123226573 [Mangifera indica]|uniref:uncharacterized protein LOC123226573 n=1 Tax=Mangifera indica TaxID=29780 RepID=UPI001CFB4FB3|nr:uncharacterized protein LOC123226573 [Mangifera indica]